MMSVLMLGLKPALVENFRRELTREDVELLTGTDLDGLRIALLDHDVDHVIPSGGQDVAKRAKAVREVFQLNDRATMHMKEVGLHMNEVWLEGFVPFARAALRGLADNEPSRLPCAQSDRTDADASGIPVSPI